MAEEVVGSLAVKLALQSGSFDTGIKRVGAELKNIDSEFKASAAEAAAAGEKYDTLGQKQTALSQKLEVQQAATVAYRGQLDQLKTKMASLGTAQTELREKVATAKTVYEQAKNELEAHRKAGDLTEDEMKQLAKRVEELGSEYKNLTNQEKQVTANLEKMPGQITKAETAYNDMRTQTAQTRQELNRTEAEIKAQSGAWGKLQAAAEKAEKPLEKAGKAMSSVGTKLTVGLTLPITAALYEAGDAAMDYEDQLAKIGTMPGVTAANLKTIGSGLIAISNDTNTAVSDMAEAEYQALSAGVAVSDSTDYMAVSARAAKGGFTDLTTAVDGNTSVLNAWKLNASASTDVYNKMIVAQNFGKTTLGEIASNIGQVASTAAGLKISYTEVLAASAAMTKGGISTSQSMTMLNQVLANVLKPTADAQKTAKALGLEFDATAIKTKGLAGFLKDIEEKAGGNETALAKLFGSVEAYKAVAALAGSQSKDFADALAAMENSAGAVDSAFETVSDTTGNKARAALNRLKNEALEFGDVMLPAISGMLDKVDGLIDGLNGMDDATRKNLLLGAGAVALIGPTTKALGTVTTGLSGVAKIITTVKGAGGLSGALGLVGLPLAAGAAAIGVAALIGKIIEMNSESTKVKDRIMKVSLELDDESKADFAAKVDDVKVQTEKVMQIQATVDTEKTDLAASLETAIADGKFTKGEGNKLRKSIDAWVDDAIEGVKTDMQTRAAEMQTVLDGIAGLSDEAKTGIVTNIETQGDRQITELQGYQTELDELLKSMQGGTEAITADQIARYNELLDLIATMKGEIEIANEGLTDYYEAQKLYMESGKASPEQAQAYTSMGIQLRTQTYTNDEENRKQLIAEKKKALDLAQEAADETGDYESVVIIKADIETEFEEQEQSKQKYADDLVQLLNDGTDAALSSVENGDNRLSELLNQYMMLGIIGSDTSDFAANMEQAAKDSNFAQNYTDAINQVLGTAYSPDDLQSMNMFGDLSTAAANQLKTSITTEMETGDFNPVLEMLKTSMDGVDLSEIDTSKLSSDVKGLFALADFDDTDGDVSKNIWQGLADGLDANYGIASDAMQSSSDDLIALVKTAWGIQSPSTVMKDIFKNVVLGGAAGVNENITLLTSPFQTLIDTAFPKLGTGVMDALINAMNGRAESLKTAMVNSISAAITAAQLKANKGIKIPVSLTYASASTEKFSQQLGL